MLSSFVDVKEERIEKKPTSVAQSSTSTLVVAAPSVKQSTSSNSIAEKEIKKEVKERESTTEKCVSKERSSTKESKRDKDDNDGGNRKRERGEKRRERERERKTISPAPYFDPAPIERYYSTDQYDERERDRDLSSISNSSNGSTNRRSQDSPDHDRGTIVPVFRCDNSKFT